MSRFAKASTEKYADLVLWVLYPTFGRGEIRGPDCMLPERVPAEASLPAFHPNAFRHCMRMCYPNGIERS